MTHKGAFIQIPILVIIVVLAISFSCGGYFLFSQYKNIQTEKNKMTEEQDRLLYQKLEEQNRLRDEQIQKLEGELTELKNKPPQIVTVAPKNETIDIIKEWTKRVVFVYCEWRYSDTKQIYMKGSGSGVIWPNITIDTGLMYTNRHVINTEGGYFPEMCTITVPNDKIYTVERTESIPSGASPYYAMQTWGDVNHDLASLTFVSPSKYVDGLGNMPSKICKTKASIGEKIVILGYPSIGSSDGVTATEGIVSGYDGDYYITSAKIDKGNSGGAAISIDRNCFLGIPTYVLKGQLESLARILNACSVAPLSYWCQ